MRNIEWFKKRIKELQESGENPELLKEYEEELKELEEKHE